MNKTKYEEKYIVGYIDILGFSNKVKSAYRNNDFSEFDKIIRIVDEAKETYKKYFNEVGDYSVKDFNFNFKYFSDTILLSLKIDNFDELITFNEDSKVLKTDKDLYGILHFLIFIQSLYNSFIEEGILCRGSVCIGNHFEDKDYIFSHALLKAYNIEKEVAIYPRIVIDNEVIRFVKLLPVSHYGIVPILSSICVDNYGIKYYSPLWLLPLINTIDNINGHNQSKLKIIIKDKYLFYHLNLNTNIQTLNRAYSLFIDEFEKIKTSEIDYKIIDKLKWMINKLEWCLNFLNNLNDDTIVYPKHDFNFYDKDMNKFINYAKENT